MIRQRPSPPVATVRPQSGQEKPRGADTRKITKNAIEAVPDGGLMHSYLIDADDTRRTRLHRVLSGRPDMVARAYRDRDSFLAGAATLDPGCVLLFGRDEDDGVPAFIRKLHPLHRFACIIFATPNDMRAAIEAMKAGAVDCLLHPCGPEAILASVEEAQEQLMQSTRDNAALAEARKLIDRLTSRERDVLHGLMQGKSNKMIALDLNISPRTVEIYRAHMMEKLGTHSLSETLKIAFAAGVG